MSWQITSYISTIICVRSSKNIIRPSQCMTWLSCWEFSEAAEWFISGGHGFPFKTAVVIWVW